MRLTFAKLLFLSLVVVLAAGGMVVVATNPVVRLVADELAGRVRARLQASPPPARQIPTLKATTTVWKGVPPGYFEAPVELTNQGLLTAHGTDCKLEPGEDHNIVDCAEFSIFVYDRARKHANGPASTTGPNSPAITGDGNTVTTR